jgi:hypothetical protein
MGERRTGGEDVLWMPGVADLVKSVNQGALPLRLEGNVEVNGGACGWVAQALPVFRDGVPRVHSVHITPTLWKGPEGFRMAGKKNSGNDGENRDRDRMVAHVGVESLPVSTIQCVLAVKEAGNGVTVYSESI